MAEQRYDGLDQEERGGGQGRRTLAASGSAGGFLLLQKRGKFTMARYRRQHISACFMAWAVLRSLRRLTNQTRHSCDKDKQAHIAEPAENMSQANEFHDSRTVWQRLCSSRRVSIGTGRLGPLHEHNF